MQPLRLEIPATVGFLGPARRLVETWLQEIDVIDDRWTLIATELLTNAIEAAIEPPVELLLEVHGPEIHLRVRNRGGAFAAPDEPAGTVSIVPRGRGLRLVRALTSDLWVRNDAGWTEVGCSHVVPIESSQRLVGT